MPKARDRDFFVNARRVVEVAIDEQMDGEPLPAQASAAKRIDDRLILKAVGEEAS